MSTECSDPASSTGVPKGWADRNPFVAGVAVSLVFAQVFGCLLYFFFGEPGFIFVSAIMTVLWGVLPFLFYRDPVTNVRARLRNWGDAKIALGMCLGGFISLALYFFVWLDVILWLEETPSESIMF